MEKHDLAVILSEVFIPMGFKKKGMSWVLDGTGIIKMVNLQKSQFSNSVYVNYGFIINSLPLDGMMMHLFSGFGSTGSEENTRIIELLDLENDLSDKDRARELKEYLEVKIAAEIYTVNTEADISEELKKQPHLNHVPLVVKRHFNLPE